MRKTTVGIITMHKVLNFGSALQSYALLQKLNNIGVNGTIIDYQFPTPPKVTLKSVLRNFIKEIYTGFSNKKKRDRFKHFYKKYYNLTPQCYHSPQELSDANLNFNVFVAGSDQIWNPININDDVSFFLSFAPQNAKKISYSSSFATDTIPDKFKDLYAKYLKQFAAISVREQSGVSVVKELIRENASVVCDPTLLLDKTDYLKLISDSIYNKNNESFILAYILKYAYDPYPYVNDILNKVQQKLNNMKIIFLDRPKTTGNLKNFEIIDDAGPLEFISLISQAKFVVTTSFHGTAFCLNLETPFISVIKDRGGFDSRMSSLLQMVGADDRMIEYNSKDDFELSCDFIKIRENINKFREESAEYLRKAIF
ncbi:polysaccharide pyruvyl transferase family protein [Bacteroides hominis]|uniref:polysaccharide pyruvyl transferase family protein n=1 Tax=Bacteroides hominis TaxID=2763023 RepID=UPI00294A91C7|nr:polysaccharide pyruvyl transferase family protein [Bacteroides hominis (ex Liu et al. 2022)]MDV6148647.1 polysaccharide pyruvyl transferase family protein [Bacteroides hominis (ex Liu et al. 2022)]